MTQRVQQGTAAGCVIFAGWVMMESLKLQFYTKLGPGPGFFPFILGGVFGLLSAAWFIQIAMSKSRKDEKSILPDRAALLRVLAILAGLAAVALLMDTLGFQLSMLIFLFVLIKFLGKQKPVVTTIVSLAGSVGIFHLFGKFLDLSLPTASIPFLAAIGL